MGINEPDSSTNPPAVNQQQITPPGLVGSIAQFIYASAPRQNFEAALSGAITWTGGVCGNSFSINNTGLNQYSLLISSTGSGKDAVASGVSKLNSRIHDSSTGQSFVHSGPGDIVSGAGLIKWLAENPCIYVIIGEAPHKFKEMANPRNPTAKAIERVLLQLYSKSGPDETFDPLAYSDRDKRTPVIHSPSLTIFGEGTDEGFERILCEQIISSGLLPRFNVFEYKGLRPRLNKGFANVEPPPHVVQSAKDLVAICAALRSQRKAINVGMRPDAERIFSGFDDETTDFINSANGEVYRQLWNRAHLKALKLAALVEVGINPHNPIIGVDAANWAIALVRSQTESLISRFASGNVGEEDGNQAKQHAHIYRIVGKFITTADHGDPKLNKMVASASFPKSWVQQRVQTLPAFKPDARRNLDSALKSLCEADELREMPRSQSGPLFDTTARCYSISNPDPFIRAL